MCGIFGFWLKHKLNEKNIASGHISTEELYHRGPDSSGFYVNKEEGFFLGHRRLSIIDKTDGGSQPFVVGRSVLAFNGEIYNYIELRQELKELGEDFLTNSDTEVLFKALRKWDIECLNKLDAMYAFVFLHNNSLSLATDPFGEKPLYYYESDAGIYFSSEPAPLIKNLKLKFEPTKQELAEFLLFGFFLEGKTGYPGLKRLGPGTILNYDPEKGAKYFRYKSNSFESGDEVLSESNLDEISHILIKSLKRRFRSDVPVGIFLSSGVDSSLLAAISSKELHQEIRTYTIAFPDGINEAPHASAIAKFLNTQHKTITSSAIDLENLPEKLQNIFGVPNDNVTALSVFRMSQLAKEDITVALTGSGGDELALGYNKYKFCHEHRNIYAMPPNLLKCLSGGRYLSKINNKTNTLYTFFAGRKLERIAALKNGLPVNKIRFAFDWIDTQDCEYISEEMLSIMHNFDLNNTLPCSYLAAMDSGSMKAEIEIRAPFLNTELFEYMRRFDRHSILDSGLKAPVTALLRRYLPDELIQRKKYGFIAPLHHSASISSDFKNLDGIIPKEKLATNFSNEISLRLSILNTFLS